MHGGFACSTDCLPNAGQRHQLWPGTVLTLSHPLGVQIVCLGYLWIFRNVDKRSEKMKKMKS